MSLQHLLPLERLSTQVADEGKRIGVQVEMPLQMSLEREALRALGALISRFGLNWNTASTVVLYFVLPGETHRGKALAAEGAQDSLAPLSVRPPHVHLGRCGKTNKLYPAITYFSVLSFQISIEVCWKLGSLPYGELSTSPQIKHSYDLAAFLSTLGNGFRLTDWKDSTMFLLATMR